MHEATKRNAHSNVIQMAILQEKLNHNLMQSIATKEDDDESTSLKLNDIYWAVLKSFQMVRFPFQ